MWQLSQAKPGNPASITNELNIILVFTLVGTYHYRMTRVVLTVLDGADIPVKLQQIIASSLVRFDQNVCL